MEYRNLSENCIILGISGSVKKIREDMSAIHV